MSTPFWIGLKRREGVLFCAIALAEIVTVFFLVPRTLGRHGLAPFFETLTGPSQSVEEAGHLIAAYHSFFGLLAHFGSAVLVAVAVGLVRRRPLTRSYGFSGGGRNFLQLTLLGLFAGLAISFLPNVLKLVDHFVVDIGPGSIGEFPLDLGYWVFMAVVGFLLVPIYEEFLLRGYMLGRINESFRPGESVILIAFLFGFAHVQYAQPNVFSIGFMVAIVINSLILGYLVFRTNSIWPSVVAHMVVNFPTDAVGKLAMLAAFAVLAVVFARRVADFLKDGVRLLRRDTRWLLIVVSASVPIVMILAVLNRIPYGTYVAYAIAAAALSTLAVRSAWSAPPDDA